MTTSADPITTFLNAVNETPGLWNSLDTRILAVRREGAWHNLITRCYLDWRPPEQVTRFERLPHTPIVRAWQMIRPVSEVETVLRSVNAGQLAADGEEIHYRAFRAPPQEGAYSFNEYLFSDLSEHYRTSYRYWSSHTLSAHGNSVHDLVIAFPGRRSELDNALRTLDEPYDGLDGVAQHAIGSPERLEANRVCLFEIFAPLEALIRADRCTLEHGRLTYVLRAGSRTAADLCALGIFALGAEPVPQQLTVRRPTGSWEERDSEFVLTGNIDLPGATYATLLLRVGKCCVHRATVIDVSAGGANPRMELYEHFDGSLEILRESLTAGGSASSGQFERAVARLFTLAGFQVDYLSGDKRFGEGVDLLAYAPFQQSCLAIECTISSLGSQGKPGKLVARISALRELVPHLEVWGALATPLERGQVGRSDMLAVASDELMVLCKEDLLEVLTMAAQSRTVADVISHLRTKIPEKQRTGPPAPGRRAL